jgi:hypothetical protein
MCAEPLTGSEATKEGIEETIIQVLQTGMHTVELLEEESIQSKCKVSSQVTCKLSSTGQDCDDLVVPIDQCGETDLDFTFTYCNLENEFIALKSDKTIGLVNTKAINELNLSNLNKGECRSETVTRKVNTCKRFFSASLKVEGLRGGRPGGIDQDYCYAVSISYLHDISFTSFFSAYLIYIYIYMYISNILVSGTFSESLSKESVRSHRRFPALWSTLVKIA